MNQKQIVILCLFLSLLGQGGLLFAQDAKLLKTVRFSSIQMKEGNDKSTVAGSVDVYYWSTFDKGEKGSGNTLLIEPESKISLSLSNFQWDKLRWGLGRTKLVFQGNRFARENPTFTLERLTDGSQFVETDQSVFLPTATASDPGKIELTISPRISKACTTAVKLKLKLYAIKGNNVDEGGTFDRVTAEDILIEILFSIRPPSAEDDLAWRNIIDLKEDIFGQTAAIQKYLSNFGECGKYADQASQGLMANEDRLCQQMDKGMAESYLSLYKKLGWKGSCVAKAQSLTGGLKEEDFYQKALQTKQLSRICEYLETFGEDPAFSNEAKRVTDHLNQLITKRWEIQFGDQRPQTEEDKTDCQKFLSYLDRCPTRIMDPYINKRNAGRRWLARVCVRAADQCELLWQKIQPLSAGESLTRLQRAYCETCYDAQDRTRYWEILHIVKPKIVPLTVPPSEEGTKTYSFQLGYIAAPLQWHKTIQLKEGEEIELDTLSQLQIHDTQDSIIADNGKIQIHFSSSDIIDIVMPSGIQGEFDFYFTDSLGKKIVLPINTRLRPLEAVMQEGGFEGEYKIKVEIVGGDSLLANGKPGYRMIFQHIDDPEISFAFPFEDRPADGVGVFMVDKEKDLDNLPDGLYEVIVRDARNDETHEVRLRNAVAIKHGGRIPTGILKVGLAVLLLLMVSWLSYANIRVAKKARKK